MEQNTEASQAVDDLQLLDDDGENRAVRTFLMQYSCDRSTTVGAMLAHMSRSGWRGYAPDFALEVRPETHLTKAGAQIWIRHLMSLEDAALKAQPAYDHQELTTTGIDRQIAPDLNIKAQPAPTEEQGNGPVRAALQVCVKALEFRKDRNANDEFALNLARIALAGVK